MEISVVPGESSDHLLPNELLMTILSDVLSTFLDSYIFSPRFSKCWNGLYTLRKVSKQFRLLVDHIWERSVGPIHDDHRPSWVDDVKLLRSQVFHVTEAAVSAGATPLIRAYDMYVAGLTLESYSNLDPLATVATDDKAKIFRAENAYASAMEFSRQTVPKDMAWLLIGKISDQRVAHKNSLIIEYTKILLEHYNPILVEILESNNSTTLERWLVSCRNNVRTLEGMINDHPGVARKIEYKLMDSLRRALENLPASLTQVTSTQDEKETLATVKQEIVKSLDAIMQTWQKDFRSARMHSITMRRAVATTSRISSA